MKVEKKLAIFSRAAVSEAQASVAAYLRGLDDQLAEEEAAAASKAQADADEALNIARRRLDERNNREILAAEREATRGILDQRARIVKEIFDNAETLLAARLKDSKDYHDGLLALINETLRDFPAGAVLTLTSGDLEALSKHLPKGLETRADDAIIGGFTLSAKERGLIAELTAARLLEEAKTDFEGFSEADND